MTFQSIPKVELHLHLEGAADPDFVRQIATEKKIDVSGVFDETGSYKYKDFAEFLSVYEGATKALKTPEDYARLTRSVLENCAENGVIYAEAFLSPDFMGQCDMVAWREYLAATIEAAGAAERDLGITMRGIVTCVRHFGPDQARISAKCAAEVAGDWVVGFGMGGAENAHSAVDFAYAFDIAREAGLRLTSHAGEWCGATEVADTLRDLRVERIGHGVQSIDDPKLIEQIVEQGIVLEVCPGSNVALGVVPDWASHPIERLRAAGVKVTVSTDDPPFFHTTMTHEFEMLNRTFDWGDTEFSQVNHTAIDAAFCDADTRANIKARLD
ncbi:MAG: adenosine deaminase [Paracoccaceae bacterium]|jgi:adenosine deaminase|nr:adenosine deaminase [Paracoccaceae bacterium]